MEKWEKAAGYALLTLLVLALTIHLVSLAGINLQAIFPPVFVMHLFAFGSFILGFVKMMSSTELTTPAQNTKRDPLKMYKWIFQNSSKGVFILFILLLIYGVINFGQFTSVMEGGGPGIINGQWVLQNHGTLIREITLEEYNYFQSQELRGFSGIWMVFICFGLALYWPWKKSSS